MTTESIMETLAEPDDTQYHWYFLYFETYDRIGRMLHRNSSFAFREEKKLPAHVISEFADEWTAHHKAGLHPTADNTMCINIAYMGLMRKDECLTKP